jgi:beta-glucosidase
VEEPNGGLRRRVSRRKFLTMASSGVVFAAASRAERPGVAGDLPSIPAAEVKGLDTGGIAPERFENARKRAAAFVTKMTLAEKISQFGAKTLALWHLGLPPFNYDGSEALHGLIHPGPVTSFPLPLALGCSWNRSLIQRVFTAVSDEIWAWHKQSGQSLAMFSPPTVNMGTRDPRWGRIAENYSEDPCLVGQMAVYTIHGMQGNDPRYLKTIACAKHFIANDTETGREWTSSKVDPRSFWEYYTRGFEACVREGQVFTVMSSYNALNGTPTTASRFLLTDVLRKRWGFRGYVVSDCDAVADICWAHHFVRTPAEAAALAVKAGCDINCGPTLQKYLAQAVARGLISESVLDQSLIRSITGRVLLGEFDPPHKNPYNKISISCLESPAHRELAREAARQSIVLFKNDQNTLPLEKSSLKKLVVIGPMADVCHLGNYSGAAQFRSSPLAGISAYLGIPVGVSYRKRASDLFRHSRGPQLEACSEGGNDLGYIRNGSWAAYRGVVFSGATEFHARVASNTAGGTIEVLLDHRRGPVVAEVNVRYTGGWQRWVRVSAPVKSVSGEHTVYLRFRGGRGSLLNIQSFYLTPSGFFAAPVSAATELAYAMGCTVTGPKDRDDVAEAVRLAREADVALVFVGADQQVDREAHDRSYIHLPGVQHHLVQAVYAANPRTILVISSNAPVAVNWEQEHLPAIVGGMFLGEQQGLALADILFGDYNPGGKVTTTWYRAIKDLPNLHDYNIGHGRTYMYFRGDPLYPFGHGLSYTKFRYGNLRISSETLGPGGRITCSADVTNSGSRDGGEIVQLYVHCQGGAVPRPIKQLVNFERVHIKAGQTRTVALDLAYDDRALWYWDEPKGDFGLEPGDVDIMIGASSADIRLRGRLRLIA